MKFPLTVPDISLWLAITVIIVLATLELFYSPPNLSSRMAIDKKILRRSGLGLGMAFLATVVISVLQSI